MKSRASVTVFLFIFLLAGGAIAADLSLEKYFAAKTGAWEMIEGNVQEYDRAGNQITDRAFKDYVIGLIKEGDFWNESFEYCIDRLCAEGYRRFVVSGDDLHRVDFDGAKTLTQVQEVSPTRLVYEYDHGSWRFHVEETMHPDGTLTIREKVFTGSHLEAQQVIRFRHH